MARAPRAARTNGRDSHACLRRIYPHKGSACYIGDRARACTSISRRAVPCLFFRSPRTMLHLTRNLNAETRPRKSCVMDRRPARQPRVNQNCESRTLRKGGTRYLLSMRRNLYQSCASITYLFFIIIFFSSLHFYLNHMHLCNAVL